MALTPNSLRSSLIDFLATQIIDGKITIDDIKNLPYPLYPNILMRIAERQYNWEFRNIMLGQEMVTYLFMSYNFHEINIKGRFILSWTELGEWDNLLQKIRNKPNCIDSVAIGDTLITDGDTHLNFIQSGETKEVIFEIEVPKIIIPRLIEEVSTYLNAAAHQQML